MARIPGVEAFGARPNAGTSQVVPMRLGRESEAQARAAEAEARTAGAIQQFGQQLFQVGQRIQEREDRLSVVEQKSQFTQKMLDFESSLDGDTDYRTYGKRFSDAMAEAKQEALGNVKNDFMRKTLDADLGLDISQGLARMGKRAWAAEKDNGVAKMNEIITRNRELALNTDDPNLRESILNHTKQAIQTVAENGYISKAQAEKLSQDVAVDTAKAWLSLQPAQKQAKILKSGEGIAELIPADQRKVLLDRIDTRGVSQAHADEIWASDQSDKDMLKEARKIEDAKTRDETVTRLKSRINERDALQKDAERAAFNASMDAVIDSNSIDSIPPEIWESMNGQQRVRVRDYVEARAQKAAKGVSEDDWQVLDEIDHQIATGEITNTEQLQQYEPFLRDATLRSLRKKVQKRDTVPGTQIQRAFELRVGKTRAKWGEDQRQEFLAFQSYVLDRVRDTRPEDLDHFADRWFMEGGGTQDAFLSDDPNTLGESIRAGRTDFVIDVPPADEAAVNETRNILLDAGAEMPDSDTFYTDHYLDAKRALEAQDQAVTPSSVAAIAILRNSGTRVTLDRIRAVEAALNDR